MSTPVAHIPATTLHRRAGKVENSFRYSIDYVLLEPEGDAPGPWLFRRNRAGMVSLWDKDHGGAPGQGRGAAWVREVLRAHDLPEGRIQLLAQPRVLGHVFNPVSFWLVYDAYNALRVVIAEVTNTFGDRHSYLCHNADLSPITPSHRISARKLFHVSPFQQIAGDYAFRFDISDQRIGIWIDYTHGSERLFATLTGPRRTLRTRDLLWSALRRPFGARRVLALIHWQALKLWLKGAPYRTRPEPPKQEVSR